MTPRPGRIFELIDVSLPRPRGSGTRDMDDYFRLTSRVRHALRGTTPAANDAPVRNEAIE